MAPIHAWELGFAFHPKYENRILWASSRKIANAIFFSRQVHTNEPGFFHF